MLCTLAPHTRRVACQGAGCATASIARVRGQSPARWLHQQSRARWLHPKPPNLLDFSPSPPNWWMSFLGSRTCGVPVADPKSVLSTPSSLHAFHPTPRRGLGTRKETLLVGWAFPHHDSSFPPSCSFLLGARRTPSVILPTSELACSPSDLPPPNPKCCCASARPPGACKRQRPPSYSSLFLAPPPIFS